MERASRAEPSGALGITSQHKTGGLALFLAESTVFVK